VLNKASTSLSYQASVAFYGKFLLWGFNQALRLFNPFLGLCFLAILAICFYTNEDF
jgi:hypothetical protein